MRSGVLMFQDVDETWNPITGCEHNCIYCWSRRLVEARLRGKGKYANGFKPSFHPQELKRRFKPNALVFVSDMGDMFGDFIPEQWILAVLNHVKRFPKTRFLLLTKNPRRYLDLMDELKGMSNVLLGATIETNRDEDYRRWRITRAPSVGERIKCMQKLREEGFENLAISIEPILDFDLGEFAKAIIEIDPQIVYVGYDNYNCNLPEPPTPKTLKLIDVLSSQGLNVKPKGRKLLCRS